MKTDLFEELKKVILTEHKNDRHFLQYVRYYETMVQNKEVLKPLLDDLENWRLDIQFDDDKTDGYTYGKYILYLWDYDGEEPEEDDWNGYYDQKYANHHYEIELTRDERYHGYCTCSPEMELYNPKYKCCGNGCDWVAPSFTLRKIKERYGNFKGQERDIWNLEEKWNEHLTSYNEKVKQEKLKRLEEQLQRIEKEKDELLNDK